MNDDSGDPPLFGGQPGEPVPEVDPKDLKALWQLQRELEAQHPGQQVAIGVELIKRVCKPETDIQALGYRASMLWLLSQIARERFSVFTKDGQPSNAAIRAAAKVPVEWMGKEIRHEAPFDVNEFLRLCGEDSGGSQHG